MTSPQPLRAQPETPDEEEGLSILLVEEMPTVDLRLMVRQHAVVLFVCGLLLAVAFVIPGDVSWWLWIPKLLIALPSAFVAFIRLSQLNGVLDELKRRASGRRPDPIDDDG